MASRVVPATLETMTRSSPRILFTREDLPALGLPITATLMASSSSSSSSSKVQAEEEAERYLIRDYQGRVAVFLEGVEEPEMIFDIYTKTLPELDQQQLTKGIPVEGYQQMTRLVEDYIS